MQTWVYKYSLFEYIVCDLQDMNMNLPSIFSSEAEHQGNMPKSAENVYLVIYRPTEAPHFRSKEKMPQTPIAAPVLLCLKITDFHTGAMKKVIKCFLTVL